MDGELLPLIAFDNVSFAYSAGRGTLTNVTMTYAKGSYTLFVGPSGAGKSTLLRLLVRLEEPVSGEIRFMEKPLTEYPPAMLRQQISLLPQTPTLCPGTVREMLTLPFGFTVNKGKKAPSGAELATWMERLSLSGIPLEEDTANLSVGQQQRLCLIRALLLEPQVLLLDEPTSALDAESRNIVLSIVAEIQQTHGVTVIQIDHSGYTPPFPHTRYLVHNGIVERDNG